MYSLLLIIDLQQAFINENTKNLLNKIIELINSKKYDKIVFTRFINQENSIYIKRIGWHGCLQANDQKIVIPTNNNIIIDKTTYSASNPEFLSYLQQNNIKDIYLCGIDTECCVLKTAFDLFELGYNVYVLSQYCKCMYGEDNNRHALDILRRNIGSKYII